MSTLINKKIWIYVERLYIQVYSPRQFIEFLEKYDIKYRLESYTGLFDFDQPGDYATVPNGYSFMSEENESFMNFMERVPTYKYKDILTKIVFDEKIQKTKNIDWNYYGEYVSTWYPKIVEFLNLADMTIDYDNQEIIGHHATDPEESRDFLKHQYNDVFLDYIRKEINECYDNELYLSVMILSRKLLETTIIRVFEVVFPKLNPSGIYDEENHNLWYNKNKGRHHDFGVLIDNLKNNSSKFDEDRELVQDICVKIKPFKDETNSFVHKDYKIPDETDVKSWKIALLVSSLFKVYKKYCNP